MEVKKPGTLLVGFDFTHGKETSVLIVGQKDGGGIHIVNAFQGDDAEAMYELLTTSIGKKNETVKRLPLEDVSATRMRDRVNGYTIYTVVTLDGGHATAVWHEVDDMPGDFAFVERYGSHTEAKAGHQYWVDFCEKHQPTAILDVDSGDKVTLRAL